MSLNIKNERTHALVRELAQRTGVSQTRAVEDAVQRRLDELRGEDTRQVDRSVDHVLQALATFQAELTDADRASIRRAADEMYDEHGLPR